jgi:hypothetical protein
LIARGEEPTLRNLVSKGWITCRSSSWPGTLCIALARRFGATDVVRERGDVLEGRMAGLVFDHATNIEGVPDGYRAMNDQEAIKVIIEF